MKKGSIITVDLDWVLETSKANTFLGLSYSLVSDIANRLMDEGYWIILHTESRNLDTIKDWLHSIGADRVEVINGRPGHTVSIGPDGFDFNPNGACMFFGPPKGA